MSQPTSSKASPVVKMDEQQLHQMTEVLGADLRSMKSQLESERAEKQRLIDEAAAREQEFKQMQDNMNAVKEEKRQHFEGMIKSSVDPFLADLRKSGENDARFTESVDRFRQNLNKGLDGAFMDKNDMAAFQTIRAAASANQVTSSRLEELFQSQKQWEEKFNELETEKKALEAASSDAVKAASEGEALKDKMLADLKKELSELKAIHEKNVNNVEAHFEGGTTPTAPVPEVPEVPAMPAADAPPVAVAATASSDHYYNGFETLFDFKPRNNWRSNKRDL